MSLLFESIRLQDGILRNLEYHNARLNYSRKTLYKSPDSIDLAEVINIPADCRQGVYKCKVIYSREIKNVEFKPYLPRTIKSLRLIEDNTISYKFKYSNRGRLNALLTQRERYDEILIIKNGFITDTSYSNIVFFDGEQWFTPSTPLLKGTMRSFMLENNLIIEKEIKATDIRSFEKARLINAMIPFESGMDIKIAKIGY